MLSVGYFGNVGTKTSISPPVLHIEEDIIMARVVYREGPHGDCLVELDGHVRIESGLPFKVETATPELLHNDVTHPDYVVGAPDARGKAIEHGKEIAYIDFYAPRDHAAGKRTHPHAYKVYHLEPAGPDDPADTFKMWKRVGGRPPQEILESMGVPADVSENPVLQQSIPPEGSLIEDVDHPMHHMRWLKHSEWDTLPEAEKAAQELLKRDRSAAHQERIDYRLKKLAEGHTPI
jgi:hypothetical protein